MSVDTQYGKPLVIKDDTVHELEPVSLSAAGEENKGSSRLLHNTLSNSGDTDDRRGEGQVSRELKGT